MCLIITNKAIFYFRQSIRQENIDMPKFEIHPSIKEAIRHNSLILFIGSGYSRNIGLPTWDDLAKKMVAKLSKNHKSLEALKTEVSKNGMVPIEILDTLFEMGHDIDCKKLLKDIIDIDLSKHDLKSQEKIWRLSEKVITTNYDRALESALDEDRKDKVRVTVPGKRRGISIHVNASYLYKIHGTIDRPQTCVLFPADYDQLYKYNHAFLTELKRLCANSVLLFVGYSVSDIEVQQILGNINTLFHIGTRHFIVTPDVNDFKKIGIETIQIKDYSELIPYLDELVSYRQQIVRNFSAIEERVNATYIGKKDLLQSLEKDNTLFFEKEAFKRKEDRKDILQLQSLNTGDLKVNESIINSVKAKGKEEQLKDYLLLLREAFRWENRAYFEHVENGGGEIDRKYSIEARLKALEIAKVIFGETNVETVNLYNLIGLDYKYTYDFENAESYLKQGLRLALKTGEHTEIISDFYNNLGNFEIERNLKKALQYYQQVLHINQENGYDTKAQMFNVATALLLQRKYEEAKMKYKQILQDTKLSILDKAETYKALGLAHVRLKEHEEAISCYEQAVSNFFEYYGKENKQFILFYNDIGYSFSQIKQYEKSVAYYEKAIALEENAEHIYIAMNNVGQAYYKAEKFKEAKAAFEKSYAFLKQTGPQESEYPDAYEYCKKWIERCREKMEQSQS